MSEFSQRPFAAGVVTGLRSWAVTADGVLTGVAHRLPWGAGENLAVCVPSVLGMLASLDSEHQVATLGCRCGFYAYFDGCNDYARSVRVSGIIDGYGVVTVGHRGFRSSKARVVAFVQPEPFVQTTQVVEIMPGVFFDTGEPVRASAWQLMDAVRKNYPEVPVYASEAEALAAHPLSKPQDLGVKQPSPDQDQPSANVGISWGARSWPSNYQPAQALDLGKLFGSMAASAYAAARALDQFRGEQVAATSSESMLERKRAASEALAARRQHAGLRGVGGIDRKRGERR